MPLDPKKAPQDQLEAIQEAELLNKARQKKKDWAAYIQAKQAVRPTDRGKKKIAKVLEKQSLEALKQQLRGDPLLQPRASSSFTATPDSAEATDSNAFQSRDTETITKETVTLDAQPVDTRANQRQVPQRVDIRGNRQPKPRLSQDRVPGQGTSLKTMLAQKAAKKGLGAAVAWGMGATVGAGGLVGLINFFI